MKLGTYLKEAKLDEAAFSALSGGVFSPEAVRKWRFGARVPRPKQMALIAQLTGGKVSANDFMLAAEPEASPSEEAAA